MMQVRWKQVVIVKRMSVHLYVENQEQLDRMKTTCKQTGTARFVCVVNSVCLQR